MSYQLWTEAISRHWFQSKNQGRSIVLAADEALLKSVAYENGIPLDTLTASQHFVRSIRQDGPWSRRVLPAEKLPATSAYLALAILAVSKMDGEVRQGVASYWMPFNELYGHNLNNGHIPNELRSIWSSLWLDVKEWANEKNGGKFGIVRFPDHKAYGIRDPHKHIRFPKSQSLLKYEDLRRLNAWFDRIGLQPGESLSRSWFISRLREDFSDASEFTTHSRRVLQDDLRFDAAVEQLLSHFSEWSGEVWNPELQRSLRRTRSRLVFAFRQKRAFRVGVQVRRDSKWVNNSQYREFPPSKASDANFHKVGGLVAAVWCDQSELFVQSKMIAANDRFLILMTPPTYLGNAREKSNYISQVLEDLERVSGRVEAYASMSTENRMLTCREMPELQRGWWMFSGIANEHLHDSQLTHKTSSLFAPDLIRLRVVGGVKIDRRRWMAGVGPSLQIDGPWQSGTIHCSTDAHDVGRQDTSIVFEDRRVHHSESEWPLDKAGIHRLWVVGAEGTEIEVEVAEARLAEPTAAMPGWKLQHKKWQSASNADAFGAYVSGALVVGEPFSLERTALNQSRELLDTIVSIESLSRLPKKAFSNNPLVTQLRRAAIEKS